MGKEVIKQVETMCAEIPRGEKQEEQEKHESISDVLLQSYSKVPKGNTRNFGVKNAVNQDFVPLSLDKPDKDAEVIASEESDGFV